MGYSLRQIAPDAKLTDEIALEALQTAIPYPILQAAVLSSGAKEERRRKLTAEVTLMFGVSMNLFTRDSSSQVLEKMIKGLRFIWFDPEFVPPSKSAICQARYQLGAKPMVELFKWVCHPMATQETSGAFLYGLRLMAIDGTVEDVPDTPENEKAFGRHHSDRGKSAFPQIQAVYLVESGTHGVVDAGFWPCHTSERVGGLRMMRSVHEGMLVMWDRGFHSFDQALQTRTRGAHFLGRVPSNVVLKPVLFLEDGSYLSYIYPSDPQRKKRGEHLLVRVIEYSIDDPNQKGYGEKHCLITSLLDEKQCPALPLACAYHERWEVEITIDEIDTHQRLVNHPLRSKRPVGVIQELYGLLIAHYAIRRIMYDAAKQARIDPDRISFTNALRLICEAIPEFQMVDPEQRQSLYQRLLRDITRYTLPVRDHRNNPRVVKRKMSKFHLKRPEHHHIPQPSKPFSEAVYVLN